VHFAVAVAKPDLRRVCACAPRLIAAYEQGLAGLKPYQSQLRALDAALKSEVEPTLL
jgi:hypothetical protein